MRFTAFSYAYPNARVKVKRGRLLSNSLMNNLIEASGVSDCIGVLENTEYSETLRGLTEVKEIDKALLEHQAKNENHLTKIAPENLANVLEEYLKKWDIFNLKNSLRAILNNKEYDVIPFGNLKKSKLKNLSSSATIEEYISKLSGTEYEFIQDKVTEFDPSKRGLLPIELELDKYYNEKLLKESKGNEETVKEFFGTKVDIKVIKLVLRLVMDKIPKEESEELTDIPVFRINDSTIQKILDSESISNAISSLSNTPYSQLTEKMTQVEKKSSLQPITHSLQTYQKEYSKKIYKREALGPGVILGYLGMKQNEIQNIRKITTLKEYNWKEEDIRRIVVS